jgi:peptide-methionine (S)-S-oxide reductase
MNFNPRTVLAASAALIAVLYGGTLLLSKNQTTTDRGLAGDHRPDGRAQSAKPKVPVDLEPSMTSKTTNPNLETVTFGSGCFWCTEAVFQNVRGVTSAVSGYSGGQTQNPTYEAICSGTTGHAEVIQVTYDPKEVAIEDLLRVFWRTHDPTTLNRQGHDVGTQYRSAIFYHNDKQREVAEAYKKQLDESGTFSAPIVTEISKFEKFYPAEQYHKEYYNLNPNQGYCQAIIRPKVEKFKKEFSELLAK